MSSYFTHLPKVFYKFGDEVDVNISNNLSVYIDLLDQIKNEISFYETFNILDGEFIRHTKLSLDTLLVKR